MYNLVQLAGEENLGFNEFLNDEDINFYILILFKTFKIFVFE